MTIRKEKGLFMKRSALITILFCLLAVAFAPQAWSQDGSDTANDDPELLDNPSKLGQTSMQFLSVSVHPRSAAMADAVTALELGSMALFYNPAVMAYMEPSFDVALGQTQWIVDIGYSFGSAAFKLGGGRHGTIGVSVLSVNYGDIQGTRRAGDTEAGYIDTGQIKPTALSIGAGYARSLTDRFAVGGQVKYVRQSLGSVMLNLGENGAGGETADLEKGTAAFDFGVLYRTGFRSLNFAVSIRNFASELKYAEENFELPLTFAIGTSVNLVDFTQLNSDVHGLRLSVDATHPRSHPEQLKAGLEYKIMNTLSIRGGYLFPSDEAGMNLGLGLEQNISGFGIGADYSYSDQGIFGEVHRVAVQLAFD